MQHAIKSFTQIQDHRAVPVAIYTRVSTDKQTGHRFDSCEHQAAVCRDFIRKKIDAGWFEIGHFSDEAYSGGTLDRPGIRRLMQCIAAGQIRVLLIYRLERILRSINEWIHLQDFLQEHGCRLLSPMDDHSDRSASGRLKTNMMMSLAEYERSNVAEKTRSKLEAQARLGMWRGGYVPFGYDYDRVRQQLIPNQIEAEVLRRIFSRASELAPLGQIALELANDDVRSGVRWQKCEYRERRSVGGRPFRTDVLRKLIQSPLYRGAIRHGGEEYKGQHEPLVSAEVWELANAAIHGSKHKPSVQLRNRDTHSNLLKGLLVCAECGQPISAKASGKQARGGPRYRYYYCATRPMNPGTKRVCHLGNVPALPLEELVTAFLGSIPKQDATATLIDPDSSARRLQRGRLASELAQVEQDLQTIHAKIRNCTEVLAQGGIEMLRPELIEQASTLTQDKQPLLVRRAGIRQKLGNHGNPRFDAARLQNAFERMSRVLPVTSRQDLRPLLTTFLERIGIRELEQHNRPKALMPGDRIFRLSLGIGVEGLLAAMEQGPGFGAVEPSRAGPVEFEFEVVIGRNRRALIVSPFWMDLSESSLPAPTVRDGHDHPIHRATAWGRMVADGTGVRTIARQQNVSPSLVSLHLKLVKLAPEIQGFLRDLSSPKALQHFSLRRLAALAVLPRDTQVCEFAKLRAVFG